MKRQSANKIISLVIRFLFLAIFIVTGIILYRRCTKEEGPEFELADTPLKVERIRKILELNTIRFRDEVVVDSVEYYKDTKEIITVGLQKLSDPDQMKHAFNRQGIRRRLTLIVRGELLYGIDLQSPEFEVTEDSAGVHVRLPQPELLTISTTPNQTEVYIENGIWSDSERRLLEKKAMRKMEASGAALKLIDRSRAEAEALVRRMMHTGKPIIVEFE